MEDCYRSALEDMGFRSGIASPCCFHHPTRGLHVVVHGDDFTCLGLDEDIDYYETQLAKRFELKIRGRLGIGCELTEIKILNRVVRITSEGLEYEADPRHTELITGSLGLTAANAVKTPGVKDPVPDYSITKADDLPTTTIGDFGSTDMGVSACCAIMGRRQGILKNNHDDMDVDTKSSPHCHEKDDMDIVLSDTDAIRGAQKKNVIFTFRNLRPQTVLWNRW